MHRLVTLLGLKPAAWPIPDQDAWATATRAGGWHTRGGAAAHRSASHRIDLERRYGRFLRFLQRNGQLNMQQSGVIQVTPQIIQAYIDDLRPRVRSVTLYGDIAKLRRMCELLDPGFEGTWLREIEQELGWAMRPKPKFDRIVDSDRIVQAGLDLMAKARLASKTRRVWRGVMFRDGLMIALLAHCVIRLRNFAELTIGRSLKKLEQSWTIVLEANETKSRRHFEQQVPDLLVPYLEEYIAEYRHPLNPMEQALWIGCYGMPLGYGGVEHAITETTRLTLPSAINPHLFRDCAASTAARYLGQNPHLGSALLQHPDPRVTERIYNHARNITYGHAFSEMVEDLEDDNSD